MSHFSVNVLIKKGNAKLWIKKKPNTIEVLGLFHF